jgi:mannobiose 2-epimerase
MKSHEGETSLKESRTLSEEFRRVLEDGVLRRWYPLVLDSSAGGYHTNLEHDWHISPQQEKMIVTQARHIWTTSKAADFTGQVDMYVSAARHGFHFLQEKMWDAREGGFFQIRSKEGEYSDFGGWREEKRTYGNAFGIFALAAFHGLTHDPEALRFAQRAYAWVEDHAFDPACKGYFQFLTREGIPFDLSGPYATVAADKDELGYKDQNSSIHLLEAYTELARVWEDGGLRRQLRGLLELIRDTIVTQKGYLQLFFYPDWRPVSFRNSPPDVRDRHFALDHISFGHDCETAYLLLEASHALGIERDSRTLAVAQSMLDHALANGWDAELGGFFDGGYYEEGRDDCRIVRRTKNWWAQAEGLNALLIFSRIFPDAMYYRYFLKQWNYIKTYLFDPVYGDWYEGGIDKEPHFVTGPKGHIWKGTYHTARCLMNCTALLSDSEDMPAGVLRKRRELDLVIEHWKQIAEHSR